MSNLPTPLTNGELSQAALALNEDNRVAFVFVLYYEYKEGRRWVKDSGVFFTRAAREAEIQFLSRKYGDRVRSISHESKIVYA